MWVVQHLWNLRITFVSSSNRFHLVSSLPATPYRPPLPEQDATQEEKAKNIIFPSSDLRTGEAVSQTGGWWHNWKTLFLILIFKRCHYLEIPGQHGASADGQKFEDDRRPGEDLVSEPEDKMEVSLDDEFKCEMYLSEGTMNLRSEVHLYLRTRHRNLNWNPKSVKYLKNALWTNTKSLVDGSGQLNTSELEQWSLRAVTINTSCCCCCAVVRTAFQYQLPVLRWGRPAVLWRLMVKYLAASNLIQTKLCLLFT